MKKVLFGLIAGFSIGAASASTVIIEDFNAPITIGATQAPDTWYTDRYAPAGFQASGGQLVQTISAADSATNRPGAFSSSFYNTQGRKLDMAPGVTEVSIELFVNSQWATTGQRMAGFWGTGTDNANTIMSYPILEFASDGPGAHFQGWDGAGWVNLGLGGVFAYDTMHTLGIRLNGALWDYLLDGNVLGSVNAAGSTQIGNVILQGYNNYGPNTTAGSYDIRWDNLGANGANAVASPGTLALALPILLLSFFRRRQTASPVLA